MGLKESLLVEDKCNWLSVIEVEMVTGSKCPGKCSSDFYSSIDQKPSDS